VSGAEERLADDPSSELWGEHRARYAFALRHQLTGQTVLDVACGSGFGLHMLSATAARVIGIDYDWQTLSRIRIEASPLVQGDAARLPLRTASIDQVVSFETLEHVPDAMALVRELRRVLKPGGRLVLSTPNRAFGPPELHTVNPFHIREFTADELRTLLQESFDEVQLFGQRPRREYRYVPFLMVEPRYEPSALVWKAMVRLPFGVRNALALTLSGRSFYPSEHDYCFDPEATDGSHVLVAVAR
jgi:ubiquinone/menaquinone biosynthesis C-methylase UbiE